jgi:hypothetical protein
MDTVRRSSIVVGAVVIIALPRPSAAGTQDLDLPRLVVDTTAVAQLVLERETAFAPAAPAARDRPPVVARSRVRIQQAILASLYATHITLQAVDIQTTTRGLRRGAAEANPLLRGVAGYPAVLATIKTGANAAVVVIAEKMWKKNRIAAIAFMTAVNSVMACVVRHNHNILKRGS